MIKVLNHMSRMSRNPSYDGDVDDLPADRHGNPIIPTTAETVQPIKIEFDVERVRLLVKLKRQDFTGEQARAALLLYRAQIEERATEAVKSFLLEKL